MNYIKTYESFDSNDLQKNLEKLSKIVDTKKLYFILKPYKKILRKLYDKYSTNGVINAQLIENDLNGVTLVSEGFGDNILRKLGTILMLPINLIRSLYNFIADFWHEGFTGKFMAIFISFVIFLLGFMFYQIGEHAINGIEIGIVNEIEFVPAHYETRTHTVSDGKGRTRTYTTYEYIPDTWKVEVRANNGRIEQWQTTDRSSGTSEHEEDIIRKTDEWDWVGTLKYGDDNNGKFSGGGSEGSFE